jgi:putative flippase GtrA
MTTGVRWLKFNAVGAVGIAVQLGALVVLRSGLHMNYLWATALAVEAAVVHNYPWHERFTWADRARGGFQSFLKFNVATGSISILGNVVIMEVLVAIAGFNYVVANVAAIAVCSIANFLVNDRCVFKREHRLQVCSEIRMP